MKLDSRDLYQALRFLPKNLKALMIDSQWVGKIFVGGGYLRSVVAGEPVHDVDVFVPSKEIALVIAGLLTDDPEDIIKTDNALTIKGKTTIQVIHRWVFDKMEDVSNSFDYTVCCAVIGASYNESGIARYDSYCDDRFYVDLAAKRLVYRSPVRNEDAGGSMLRLLKYYVKGYRVPLDSVGAIIARLIQAIDTDRTPINNEAKVAEVITGLLREVDPNIDPTHEAHLPTMNVMQEIEGELR
ncbi:hypothetical protein GCM10027051_31610 [Niabella terrae]